jgi:subtilisin family serine protease
MRASAQRLSWLGATWLLLAPLMVWGDASGSPAPEIQAGAVRQIAALAAEKRSRTPVQQKIDSRLLLAARKLRHDPLLSQLPQLRVAAPDGDGRFAVEIDLGSLDGLKEIVQLIRSAGGEIGHVSRLFKTVNARIPASAAETIAASPQVRRVKLDYGAVSAGINVSQGDTTHRVREAREFFGVTGAGIKICVLSDGIDGIAAIQESGDLPADIEVLPGQRGRGSEGAAMLEIVHDLAPGARLAFATAANSFASFAENVLALHQSGCHVIVDDIFYIVESPFQDLGVAEAVNRVTAAGVLYFSSSGNEGNLDSGKSGTWQGDFRPGRPIASLPPEAGIAHNFGDGSTSNRVAGDSLFVTLHWSDPFAGSANDYDLYLFNDEMNLVLDASTNFQNGNDDPVEGVGRAYLGERLAVVKSSGEVRMIYLSNFRGQLEQGTAGCTRGHSAVRNAMSVAAVNVSQAYPGPFQEGQKLTVEPFSCDGPRRIFFDNPGNLLPGAPPGNFTSTGGVVRRKPDITAADGVSTATPGFDPFFGTSAAAPHAAAIAALLKEAFPTWTPLELRRAMKWMAFDAGKPGFDRTFGNGVTMAHETLAKGGARPAATLQRGTLGTTEIEGDGDPFLEPGETWSLAVELRNVGGAAATAVRATLLDAPPGLSVQAVSADFPEIPAGESATNATPLSFRISPAVPCGGRLRFRIEAAFAGGLTSPLRFDVDLATGEPAPPAAVSYAGLPVEVADAAGAEEPGETAEIPFDVSGLPGRLRDVNFQIGGTACESGDPETVGIRHGFIEDLQIDLVAPSGTAVRLIDRVDLDGNHFCQTVLDDEGGGAPIQGVETEDAPFTGSFLPATPLAVLQGEAPNGTWKIRVTDFFPEDSATVRSFGLVLTGAVCSPAGGGGEL